MKRQKIYEGRTKRVYNGDNENELLLEFKDTVDELASSGKKVKLNGKGGINSQISSLLFRFLSSYNIPNHFIDQTAAREIRVKKLEMIPLEIVVRNIAAGSLVKRYKIEEGKVLECPVIEFYLKSEEDTPLINEDHIVAFGHALTDELKEIHRLISKTNVILKDFFRRRSISLVDFNLEFGRREGEITLGDEISLDTCRLWDLQTDVKMSKGQPIQTLEELEENYKIIKDRILT